MIMINDREGKKEVSNLEEGRDKNTWDRSFSRETNRKLHQKELMEEGT